MKTVLVAGAASGAGEGIVAALLDDPTWRVIGTSREGARLEELRERLPPVARDRLVAVEGDAGDFAGAQTIARQAAEAGGIDGAVAIFGRGWYSSGPILELREAEWRSVLGEMLTAHFAFAQAVIPVLEARPDPVYLSIGGGAAFEPVAGSGLMSVAAAGQAMLTRTLARERGSAPPRILELVINGPLRTRDSAHFAEPGWITAADVGRTVRELLQGEPVTWPAMRTTGPLLIMDESAKA
jgi:NAD(P)-dependent dehydrogenase (short-subunit alcohol dehydrogenase family)